MSLPSLTDLYAREGQPQEAAGNQAFWLDDPDHTWLLERGKLDVFVVPRNAGETDGARLHLFRAGAGRVLFGVTQDASACALGFLAVGGSETRLYRLSRARLRELSVDAAWTSPVAQEIDRWIETVFEGLAEGQLFPPSIKLAADEELELEVGEATQPLEGVIWVKHLAGQSRLAGHPELSIGVHDGVIPLTSTVWLEAVEPVKVIAANTAAQLEAGAVWSALASFDVQVRGWAGLKVAQAVAQGGLRLQAKAQAQRAALTEAVASLSEPLAVRPTPATVVGKHEDPLVEACQWVCQASGMGLKVPAALLKGRPSKDPLGQLARAARLRPRRVLLTGPWWRRDNGPLLAFLQATNQPVALLPTTASRYVRADPAEPTRPPVNAARAQALNPLAYTFCRPFPERALQVWGVFRFGLHHTGADLWTVLLLSLAGGVLGLAMPLATGLIFDVVIPSVARTQLAFLALGLWVAAFASVAFNLTRGIALLRIEARSDAAIQGAIWDRLLSLPLPFFRPYTAGDLALRANGINAIRQVVSGAVTTTLLSGCFSLFSLGLLFYYSLSLALVATVLVLLNMGVTLLVSLWSLRLQRPLYEKQGKISGQVLQFVTGIAKLRVAGAESQAYAVWAKAFGEQKALDLQLGTLDNRRTVFNETFPIFTSMCLFSMVAFRSDPGLSTGIFLAFNAAFMAYLQAGLEASDAVISLLHAIPLYERAQPILQARPEVSAVQSDPGELSGRLELNQVSFRYRADGPLVLQEISFQVQPGEFLAIVGSSGSGKSTLMRLLLGFEHPETGTIRYDGLDLAGLDVAAVRRQIGVVLQQGKLMPGDLLENIVGSGLFTLDDAWGAARSAGLEEDILAMPMGMHTVLGEGAATLSGGQRQRLMIARAIVAKPRLILFDEATSALDNRTQALVSESLKRLKATRIVIAHRLSTIQDADRILVLQKGRLVQAGAYASLIHSPGPFDELARRQLA
jgi:NHLM bacteriocin system ABC transporter ATP-binding protein